LESINEDKRVVLPLHPRTRKILDRAKISTKITVIDPVGYFDMLELLKNCDLVMTDSGGLQKEAFFFAKHCITLRDQTEWVELVNGGFNTITGADKGRILEAYDKMKIKTSDFSVDLYGGGKASEQITRVMLEYVK
jgi:UDP-GlcNAc3NAcA epimerase